MKVVFFDNQQKFRDWLEINHDKESELWVGYYKKNSGHPSMTWPESVDQALCFGWIDGIRKSIDGISYTNRFTPRKPNSHWSKINLDKVAELEKNGLMKPEGLIKFQNRKKENQKKASHEQGKIVPDKGILIDLKANPDVWNYFSSKSPSYQKQCFWWIMSAKREETRQKRLKILINSCENKIVIPPFRWGERK